MALPPSSPTILEDLAAAARTLGAQGLVPATSGNFSARLSDTSLAITRSGVDKGRLTVADLIEIPLFEKSEAKTSAETPLHLALYRTHPQVGAVLHTHSLAATVLSRRDAAAGKVVFSGYELQKAIAGTTTHDGTLELAIYGNDQDIDALSARIQAVDGLSTPACGFLLEGHGLYAWGASVAEALRHIIALEFLLSCRLEEQRYAR